MAEKYQSVNGSWPEHVSVPTAAEARTAAKRLFRFTMKRPFRGKVQIMSGNRYTWVRERSNEKGSVMFVNPNRQYFGGWKDLVHELSHYCHRQLYPKHKPHDGRGTHAFLERQMIEHVINSGWLDGKLKRPEKTKPDVRHGRHERVLARITDWERKRKRTDTALKKLRTTAKYYERTLPT